MPEESSLLSVDEAEETPDDSYFSIRRQQGFKHDHWRDELSLEVRKVTVLTENSAN